MVIFIRSIRYQRSLGFISKHRDIRCKKNCSLFSLFDWLILKTLLIRHGKKSNYIDINYGSWKINFTIYLYFVHCVNELFNHSLLMRKKYWKSRSSINICNENTEYKPITCTLKHHKENCFFAHSCRIDI